jgi:hypothetical protein
VGIAEQLPAGTIVTSSSSLCCIDAAFDPIHVQTAADMYHTPQSLLHDQRHLLFEWFVLGVVVVESAQD